MEHDTSRKIMVTFHKENPTSPNKKPSSKEKIKGVLKYFLMLMGILACIFIFLVYLDSSGNKDQYHGSEDPCGGWCDYGYNERTKACCDEDDYSCAILDSAPEGATGLCWDGAFVTGQDPEKACEHHEGLNTNEQFSPFIPIQE